MTGNFYYSIDTSSLLHGWVRAYPIAVSIFRPVWQLLDTLIANDRLKASVEVFNELRKKDDELTAYFKTRPNTFVEIKDNLIQNKVIEILEKYPRLVDTRKGRGGADPFVIAYAMTGKPYHTIVTGRK